MKILQFPLFQPLTLPLFEDFEFQISALTGLDDFEKFRLLGTIGLAYVDDVNFRNGASGLMLRRLKDDSTTEITRVKFSSRSIHLDVLIVCSREKADMYTKYLIEMVAEGINRDQQLNYIGLSDLARNRKTKIKYLFGWLDLTNDVAILRYCDEGQKAAGALMTF